MCAAAQGTAEFGVRKSRARYAAKPQPGGWITMAEIMLPKDIYEELRKDIIGQEEVLKYVAVAIFKHAVGEKFGNLLLIGNSGTGKTSIMLAMERMYRTNPFFTKHRVVVRTNANTLADEEEGMVRGSKLMQLVDERTRAILGNNFTVDELKDHMQHATVCVDEVDKISGKVGGKPNVLGIAIMQNLLTLMEGETVVYETQVLEDGVYRKHTMEIDTGGMLFLCAGAFEELYDQVYSRIFKEGNQEKLTKMILSEEGSVSFRQIFTLKDNLVQEDLFVYGMLPQFLSRFDNAVVLEDLTANDLRIIFMEPSNALFKTSQKFFRRFNVQLSITDKAQKMIAATAAEHARIGARALKDVYGRVIKRFEFDPFSCTEVKKLGSSYDLTIDESIVKAGLGIR